MKYIFKIIYLTLVFSVFVKYAATQDNHDHVRSNECEAKFTYSPNPVEQFTVHFNDHSTGLIQEWSWSFGDGTGSSEQNPVHTFTSPGYYVVCLTISNTDSINLCYDVFCDTISLLDSIECIAEFNYVLDSNSNTPNKYQFYDISSGGPDFWYWDFGDGYTSQEQNPQHSFNQEGQYNVCLVVAKSNIISCVDTICHLIKMPEYYSFGGFAFIGDQPINNPVHSGDTGVAFLYKVHQNQQVMMLDTNVFTDYGYFHFSNKLPGEYLIKVMLSPQSTNFENYLSTYYPDHHLWTNAQSVFVSDSNAYNMHIHLTEVPGTEPGPGKISGKVVQDQHSPFERPFAPFSTEIILATAEGQSLDFTYCDSDGNFAFRNIAYGSYKLLADHTGKYALPVLIDINEAFPNIDTVVIKVSDHNLTGIEEPDPALIIVSNIYPNPVKDNINIDLRTLNAIQVNLQILNINGSVKYARSEALAAGESKIQVSSGNLPKGVYILMIRFQSGMYVTSRKFIK